jgi:hypothetical protein
MSMVTSTKWLSEEHSNPLGDFLIKTRELVAEGNSVYGPVGSPRQVEKLAELDAKLAVSRRLGEAPPAPEPWTEERAAKERLAREFPVGDPTTKPFSETMSQWITNQFERLGKLSTREQADLAQQTADDFAYHTSAVSVGPSRYQNGGYPSGPASLMRC